MATTIACTAVSPTDRPRRVASSSRAASLASRVSTIRSMPYWRASVMGSWRPIWFEIASSSCFMARATWSDSTAVSPTVITSSPEPFPAVETPSPVRPTISRIRIAQTKNPDLRLRKKLSMGTVSSLRQDAAS